MRGTALLVLLLVLLLLVLAAAACTAAPTGHQDSHLMQPLPIVTDLQDTGRQDIIIYHASSPSLVSNTQRRGVVTLYRMCVRVRVQV